MKYSVTWSESEDKSGPDPEIKKFEFPFFVSAEPNNEGADARVIVAIDGTTFASWQLSEGDLIPTLFAEARRVLKDKLEEGPVGNGETIHTLVSIQNDLYRRPVAPHANQRPSGFVESIVVGPSRRILVRPM